MRAEPSSAGARASLMLFWDYDTQWGADRSRLAGGPQSWGGLDCLYTDRILELHAEYAVPACFAVVGAAALPGSRPYHDPDQIRRIHAAGHEVASHSHRHEWLPGLTRSALVETLRSSRDALEQCIGAPVRAFVPPFNQPFDYAAGWSFSLSERRRSGAGRTCLATLCDVLGETGYRFCRVAYRPIVQRLAEWCLRSRLDSPSRLERIGGIACLRLNTAGGFDAPVRSMIERSARSEGVVVVYGHPHSLRSGGSQDERHLIGLLEDVRRRQVDGRLQVTLPSRLAS